MSQQYLPPLGKNGRRLLKSVGIPLLTLAMVAAALYYAISTYLIRDAEEKVKSLLLSHRGLHRYIQEIMHPAFYTARNQGTIAAEYYAPEILSSSYIVRLMHGLYNEERTKAGLPEIYYKMASNNPRNPVNKADPSEATLIRMFNENRDLTEFRRIVTVDGKKYLYYAIPFLETNKACLRCHGKREDAPPELQARYPGQGGFNEKAGVIRAIESIRMPIGQEMSTAFILTCSLSGGILAMLLLYLFNARLRSLVQMKTASLEEEVHERKDREAELEVKNAELERFTYTVSHDLKSPLITIKGFAGALQKDLAVGRHDRMAGDLGRITDAADKMTMLLNDLLELSRIGRIMNPPTMVDMTGLTEEVLKQLAGPIARTQAAVTVQPGLPQVFGDRPRLAEVLQNLIENALKCMGDQAHPCIEIGMREDEGERVFFVRDNGIGIDKRYHTTIFGLFNKLEATTEGTGIGLALAQRIVELHGGRIWVESEGPGTGSTFCFTLAPPPGSDGDEEERPSAA
ncbi:MAG TPA: DUF3365 domain-containing protein [Desulfuromonadaceae bacterium]